MAPKLTSKRLYITLYATRKVSKITNRNVKNVIISSHVDVA